MDVETFKKLHNSVVKRDANSYWNYEWFNNRFLDEAPPEIRYGWFIRTVVKYLKDEMKVLDICGGIGMFGAFLQAVEGYNFDYTMLDLPFMQSIAEDYFSTLNVKGKFVNGNITRMPLPFEDESFDMIWLFGWCQIENVDCNTFFSEIYRVLKPNGIFMFNMAYDGYATSYSEEALRILLAKLNFRIEIIKEDSGQYAKEFLVLVRKDLITT